mmetsp:Transcript_25210/g.42532  ORF Transcript_25210/g.42532 Transcript_25210/m.42532 type:complete len:200 (-) Transcript_25210:422-1021(-)
MQRVGVHGTLRQKHQMRPQLRALIATISGQRPRAPHLCIQQVVKGALLVLEWVTHAGRARLAHQLLLSPRQRQELSRPGRVLGQPDAGVGTVPIILHDDICAGSALRGVDQSLHCDVRLHNDSVHVDIHHVVVARQAVPHCLELAPGHRTAGVDMRVRVDHLVAVQFGVLVPVVHHFLHQVLAPLAHCTLPIQHNNTNF